MNYTTTDTDEAINRAVHEKVMGKCWHNFHPVSGGYGSACSKCGEGYDGPYDDNPTYCTDLNAAFEAQRVAVEKDAGAYAAQLLTVTAKNGWKDYPIPLVTASAKDRCVAVLAACGVEREENV